MVCDFMQTIELDGKPYTIALEHEEYYETKKIVKTWERRYRVCARYEDL